MRAIIATRGGAIHEGVCKVLHDPLSLFLGPSACSLGRILQRKVVVTRVDYVQLNNAWASSKALVIVSDDRRRAVLELYWLGL
jgi:hypothetical protein